jgi:hypothetical protein
VARPRSEKSPGLAGYLELAQEEIEEVKHSLERSDVMGPAPRRNREINGCIRALHAIRNARTIVGNEEPPVVSPTEGS